LRRFFAQSEAQRLRSR